MTRQASLRDARSIPERRSRREQPRAESDRGTARDVVSIAPPTAMAGIYAKRVDKIEKDMGLVSSLGKQPTMSSGMLAYDLMVGRLMPGFHVVFGGEGSAKSTTCMKMVGSSLLVPIPLRGYYDAEGAIDRRYTSQVLRTDDFESVFGARDEQGRWYKHPQVRYYDSNIVEEVFLSMRRALSFMPDKAFYERNNCWMLRFDRTREQVALMKQLIEAEEISQPNKRLYHSTGRYWCETDNQYPQAVFFLDSLPQLIPERIENEQNSDNSSGWQSAALGKGMRYVRGKLRPKAAVLVSVNQLRSNVRPGPGELPYYEPAGNAVKFNSDARTMYNSVVPKSHWDKHRADNRGLCEEKSVQVEGGRDLYAFKSMTNIKNKYGPQYRRNFYIRIWIADGNGVARGPDPVFDTLHFLDKIGALRGFQPGTISDWRKRFRIDLPPIRDVDWTYESAKALIIGQEYGDRRLVRRATELGAPRFRLREYCQRLVETGRAEHLFIEAERAARTSRGGLDLESEDLESDE